MATLDRRRAADSSTRRSRLLTLYPCPPIAKRPAADSPPRYDLAFYPPRRVLPIFGLLGLDAAVAILPTLLCKYLFAHISLQ